MIEHTKLDRETGAAIGDGTKEQRVILREEVAAVNKKTIEKEAVSLGKKTVANYVKIQAELKEEKIVVDGQTRDKK